MLNKKNIKALIVSLLILVSLYTASIVYNKDLSWVVMLIYVSVLASIGAGRFLVRRSKRKK